MFGRQGCFFYFLLKKGGLILMKNKLAVVFWLKARVNCLRLKAQA
jgi:hypothetical protein